MSKENGKVEELSSDLAKMPEGGIMDDGSILMVPTQADYTQLFQVNPMAAEQLKTIILARMLKQQTGNRAQQRQRAKSK